MCCSRWICESGLQSEALSPWPGRAGSEVTVLTVLSEDPEPHDPHTLTPVSAEPMPFLFFKV